MFQSPPTRYLINHYLPLLTTNNHYEHDDSIIWFYFLLPKDDHSLTMFDPVPWSQLAQREPGLNSYEMPDSGQQKSG